MQKFINSGLLAYLLKASVILVDLALLFGLSFAAYKSVITRWKSLGLTFELESIDITQQLLVNLAHGFFVLGLLLWYLALCWPFFSKGVIKRTLIGLNIGFLLVFDIIWSATFFAGGGQNLFVTFYFLTQFNILHSSFGVFKGLFAGVTFVFFGLLSLLFIYRSIKAKPLNKTFIIFLASIGLIGLSFIPYNSALPKSTNLASIPFLLSTWSEAPDISDFSSNADAKISSPFEGIQLKHKPNIVIVVMESTRKSGISFYNPALSRKTAFFDRLASSQNTIVFSQMHTVIPFTLKALAAINCGFTPYLNMQVLETSLGLPAPCLATQLSKQGYQTRYMQSAEKNYGNIAEYYKVLGFEQLSSAEDYNTKGFMWKGFSQLDDRAMLHNNGAWLKKASKPFFVQYLTNGPHWPYHLYDKNDYFHYATPANSPVPASQISNYNNYLNSVYYQDQFLQQLFAQYKETGHLENTIFILIGDHGTGTGEHGYSQRLNNMHPEVLAIPFLIYAPGYISQNQINHQLLSQTDIVPILRNLLENKNATQNIHHQAVFSSCWYWHWCLARTDARYKFIDNFDNAPAQLYDRIRDPEEQKNIAAQQPELVQKLKKQTRQWYRQKLSLYYPLYHSKDADFYLNGYPTVDEVKIGNISSLDTMQ